jgi:tetratricopeptide (TPR) repeat protein
MVRVLRTLALLLLCAAGAQAQHWVEVKSPHFLVVTDAGEQRGREIAIRFEQMRAAFGVLFNKWKVTTAAPVQIIAFRDTRDFRRTTPIWQGKPVELSGFFRSGDDSNFIALDTSSPGRWGTVFHEYAHLLISSNFPPMPTWFDEGFAEYCSSLKMDRKQIQFGLSAEGRAEELASSPWMHVVDLFSVRHDSREYNESGRRAVFYAQSWLTVHYLMAKRMNAQLAQYLDLTENQHIQIPDAIEKAFGMPARKFENTLREYFQGGRMVYFITAAPAGFDDGGPYAVREIGELDWKAAVADLQFHSPDHHEEGAQMFREVLKQQPANVVSNRGLGYAFLQHNDLEQAAVYFQRAAAADSQDARVHYFSALLANRKAMSGSISKEDAAVMRKEVETAIRLDPAFADAYHLLAFVEAADDHIEAQRAALKKAMELNPRSEVYLMSAAQCEMRAQNFKDAEPMLRRLRESQDPQIAQFASMALNTMAAARAAGGALEIRKPEAPATAPQWEKPAKPEPAVEPAPEPQAEPEPPPQMSSIRFLKGRLVKVDCSAEPGAIVTMESGGKQFTMFTQNRKTLLLIGVDAFSCAWSNRKASVNYRLQKDGRGELVSLEVD